MNNNPWDRSRFATELQNNPGLANKIMRIAYNEQGANPAGTQGVIESMMNRANMRGTSLAQQARWHESEGGYYQQGNMGTSNGKDVLSNPKYSAVLQNSLTNALGGANTIGWATDNSSGKLAAREKASGAFRATVPDINGETFFAPGTAEKKYAANWDSMNGGGPAPVVQASTPPTTPSVVQNIAQPQQSPVAAALSSNGQSLLNPTNHNLPGAINRLGALFGQQPIFPQAPATATAQATPQTNGGVLTNLLNGNYSGAAAAGNSLAGAGNAVGALAAALGGGANAAPPAPQLPQFNVPQAQPINFSALKSALSNQGSMFG